MTNSHIFPPFLTSAILAQYCLVCLVENNVVGSCPDNHSRPADICRSDGPVKKEYQDYLLFLYLDFP